MSDNDTKAEDTEIQISMLDFPECVLLKILKYCPVNDIVAISETCDLLFRMTRDEFLWKYFCRRDFKIPQEDVEGVASYYSLYTNLLYKYGWMQGMYQTEAGPFGELLEVRFNNGSIEGVNWEASSAIDLNAPLGEYILFSVKDEQNPANCVCLPDIAPHPCSLSLDKVNSELIQKCSNLDYHSQALRDYFNSDKQIPEGLIDRKMLLLDEVTRQEFRHRTLILPEPQDIPEELLLKDGTIPPQLITPGLFKGTYGPHGTELILFKYIDENEIHGIKVTGDQNVFAQKISVKILLKYPVNISEDQENTFESLEEIEPSESSAPISSIKEQPFIIPDDCDVEGEVPPNTCKARYHGLGQIAFHGFIDPNFIRAHVMVFNSNLFGVLWLALGSFSIFQRVEKHFSQNMLDLQSVI